MLVNIENIQVNTNLTTTVFVTTDFLLKFKLTFAF